MKSFLPILIPGQSEPVRVPCSLPDSFTFAAFLPSRGVRYFTAWLTTTDPLTAEVGDVLLVAGDGDPRGPSGFELDDDEQRRADEAAVDVLTNILKWCGLGPATRAPLHTVKGEDVRAAIARAFSAEELAFVALTKAWQALPVRLQQHDISPAAPQEAEASRAAVMLSRYVEHVVEQTCLAQRQKAEKQRDTWASERLGDVATSGCERSGF